MDSTESDPEGEQSILPKLPELNRPGLVLAGLLTLVLASVLLIHHDGLKTVVEQVAGDNLSPTLVVGVLLASFIYGFTLLVIVPYAESHSNLLDEDRLILTDAANGVMYSAMIALGVMAALANDGAVIRSTLTLGFLVARGLALYTRAHLRSILHLTYNAGVSISKCIGNLSMAGGVGTVSPLLGLVKVVEVVVCLGHGLRMWVMGVAYLFLGGVVTTGNAVVRTIMGDRSKDIIQEVAAAFNRRGLAYIPTPLLDTEWAIPGLVDLTRMKLGSSGVRQLFGNSLTLIGGYPAAIVLIFMVSTLVYRNLYNRMKHRISNDVADRRLANSTTSLIVETSAIFAIYAVFIARSKMV